MKCEERLGYTEGYDPDGIPKGFEIRCENEATTQRRKDKVFMDFSIPTLLKKRFTYNLCTGCANTFDNTPYPHTWQCDADAQTLN